MEIDLKGIASLFGLQLNQTKTDYGYLLRLFSHIKSFYPLFAVLFTPGLV